MKRDLWNYDCSASHHERDLKASNPCCIVLDAKVHLEADSARRLKFHKVAFDSHFLALAPAVKHTGC